MAHTVRTSSHRKPAQPPVDDSHDLAVAAEDADLQAHHRLLLCMEQTRRAQMKMVQDCTEDLLATSRALASSTDPQQWLQAPAGLMGSSLTHLLAAQATTLQAWTELQYALFDEIRSNMGVAGRCVWPYSEDAGSSTDQLPISPAWLVDAIKTYEKFSLACGSAWAPDSASTVVHH